MHSKRLWVMSALAWVALAAGCRKASVENGAALYRRDCAGCHVRHAGVRLAAPALEGYFDRKPYPTVRQAREIIRDGRLYMPPFGNRLSSDEIDDLIAYMKTLR
jgi:mono/diheme cytochrome c family protein